MKRFFLPLLALAVTAQAAEIDLQGDFKGPLGLQLYSLRDTFKKDPIAAFDETKALGFKYAEVYAAIPLPPEKVKEELASRGITPIGMHFGYDDLKKDLPGAVKKAQALGLKYAGVAWIPHKEAEFGEADVKRAAADFNTFGEAFKAAGIQFFYHTHGYEFKPVSEGASDTFFDMLVKETKPDLVSYEMDVFWVFLPGVDPAKLLEKYPGRWALMHLKDMRKGAMRGVYTGHAPLTDDVPIGTGQIDWPTILKAAAKVGVKYYFIEDESPTVHDALPQSLKYLETVK
ncbi:Xylose isomerase domain protein TIM barrel [Chthoniobacter flavus Ellin428]|uniref:Xylose isomerase domain protein TIM barrel n=1 Tax=Chthoniobacter flavus Ellin428 TaxID=497964 RepID=B4CUD4_9BACT|nr:sugar phosphate isomerase/epimerase [Chthoniobacter flavus]EDY22172.1 Xylose isomerase domain protein TIM barrel [Chthoniobacter flavus Ellin428]